MSQKKPFRPLPEGKQATLASMEESARDLGRTIGASLPDGVVFFLCLANVGEAGNMTYISSADRRDMVKLIRELASKIEGS